MWVSLDTTNGDLSNRWGDTERDTGYHSYTSGQGYELIFTYFKLNLYGKEVVDV